MKNSIYSFAILVVCMAKPALGAIRTLDNNPNAPNDGIVNFSNWIDVYTASTATDTIYVQGSPLSYGDIDIFSKAITLIGPGHKPSTSIPWVATFNTIRINFGGNGSKLIGLKVDIILNKSTGTDNYYIGRCLITNIIDGLDGNSIRNTNNWIIEGCVFTGTGIMYYASGGSQTATNIIFRNNIVNGQIVIGGINTGSFYNNLFLRSLPDIILPGTVSGISIFSNIFYGSAPDQVPGSFYDNIGYPGGNFPAGGTNNQVFTAGTAMFNNAPLGAFDYGYDYTLDPLSPALTWTSGGTEIGVYGGIPGLFNMSGMPGMPHITDFTVTPANPTIPYNTPLNIIMESKRIK